jgi:malate permease and related proteins
MNIVFFAIIKLFIIVFLGYCLYFKEVLKDQTLKFLSSFVINFSIPFLFFTTIIGNFVPSEGPGVYRFFILSVLIFGLGLVLGGFSSILVRKDIRREFTGLCAFQNAGYLPMNIALFLFPEPLRSKFLVYIFLYLLGFNVFMWSVGTFALFNRTAKRFNPLSMFTPPVISAILAIIVVYTGLAKFIPATIVDPLKIVGNMGFPLSMIVLGAWLAKSRGAGMFKNFLPLMQVVIIKLLIIPAIFFYTVKKLEVNSLFGLFVVLQASLPSAVSLTIMGDYHGADNEFISQGIFVTHLVGLVTVPLWLELFRIVSGYNF